MKYAIG
jgi:hypothetical protein